MSRTVSTMVGAVLVIGVVRAAEIEVTAAMQARIDEWKAKAAAWAAEKEVVEAVERQNKLGPIAEMTEEKWKATKRREPVILQFQKNKAAGLLAEKAKETEGAVSEAFVCAAAGEKVAFLEKTSSYIHKGRPKFDTPFSTGKAWQGKPEFDESTQTYAVQIAVPILSKDKPIGVLVLGLSLSHLAK
jgi:hypothetical protein